MKTQTKIGLKCFMAAAMTFCMVAVAELTGEKEIIFPEIAALVTGAWLARKQPWNVSKTVLWITITLSAFAGVAIVKHIHVSLPFQLALAFVFTMVILTAFGTTFVPIVCACILPVFIGTDSHVYTLSVSIMALIIIMVQHLLEKNGLHEKKAFEEIGISKQVLARNAMRIALFLLVAMPPLYFGHLYFIAPPIIVGYVELSDRNSTARQSPLTIWLLFIVSSVLGYLAKEANISMDVPLYACALIAFVPLMAIYFKVNLMLPPAGALALLPLLLPEENIFLYPIEATAGSGLLIFLAISVFKRV